MNDWTEQANCRGCDTDMFFPKRGDVVAKVRAICEACQVRTECLNHAMTNFETHGVWGGLSGRERRRLRRIRILGIAS